MPLYFGTVGSVGQNGSNLMLRLRGLGEGAGIAEASVWSTPLACMVGSSVVAMGFRSESSLWSSELLGWKVTSRRGHQCSKLNLNTCAVVVNPLNDAGEEFSLD